MCVCMWVLKRKYDLLNKKVWAQANNNQESQNFKASPPFFIKIFVQKEVMHTKVQSQLKF